MKLEDIKKLTNRELCERYPFLIPRNVWTDKIVEDYDYSWTRKDEVPDGWQDLFLQACEDIREALIKVNYLDKFRFSQIKEKWGSLCLYNFGAPEEVHDIIGKYEKKSRKICFNCGKTATVITQGYVLPFCDECGKKYEPTIPITDQTKYIL